MASRRATFTVDRKATDDSWATDEGTGRAMGDWRRLAGGAMFLRFMKIKTESGPSRKWNGARDGPNKKASSTSNG